MFRSWNTFIENRRMYFYASADVPTHIKYMPTKFFYGQEQNSLKPEEVFQSSILLPQHFTFSRLLPQICMDTWERSPQGSNNQGVPAPRLTCEQGSVTAVRSKNVGGSNVKYFDFSCISMYIRKTGSCTTCAIHLHLWSFSEHSYLNATALLLELQDSRQFAEHTWTSHFISKHHPPSRLVHPLLDVMTDNIQTTGRGVRAASSLWHWTMELWVPWFRLRGTRRHILSHTQRAWEAPTRALGHPSVRGILFLLQTPRCLLVLGSFAKVPVRHWRAARPWPQHSTGRGTSQEKTQPPGCRNWCCWTCCTAQGER